MADSNLPKQDFAPPWLKFPSTDSPVSIELSCLYLNYVLLFLNTHFRCWGGVAVSAFIYQAGNPWFDFALRWSFFKSILCLNLVSMKTVVWQSATHS